MVRFLVIGAAAALCALAGVRELAALAAPGEPHPAAMAATSPQPSPAQAAPDGPGEASIAKSPDGHFWADAQVDGHTVRFLIDTGATAVVLTAADARGLGIDPDALSYAYTVTTANGPAKAAEVKLDLVSVGRAEVPDVEAFVIDHGLETSLLGMTYLGRLSTFEASPEAMVLRS